MVPSGNKECKQTVLQRETFNHILLRHEVTNGQRCSSAVRPGARSGSPERGSHPCSVTPVLAESPSRSSTGWINTNRVFLWDSDRLPERRRPNRGAPAFCAAVRGTARVGPDHGDSHSVPITHGEGCVSVKADNTVCSGLWISGGKPQPREGCSCAGPGRGEGCGRGRFQPRGSAGTAGRSLCSEGSWCWVIAPRKRQERFEEGGTTKYGILFSIRQWKHSSLVPLKTFSQAGCWT